ncbi:F-box only protein 8-like [Oopsacas minuta]|uniref:F-box only protein 8-like n=1 Tax=Oopsacas minuta TaxID=111878 RepID=A0AAV7JNS6_9METZ|nr:F-box only protein 8-like [Oopsacas minuta]
MGQSHTLYRNQSKSKPFPDLSQLPAELAVQVLSHLDATDLCLASCVNEIWQQLADDNVLWLDLCKRRWGFTRQYDKPLSTHFKNYKQLYLSLDTATLSCRTDMREGIVYLVDQEVLWDCIDDIALFILNTSSLSFSSLRRYLKEQPLLLDTIIKNLDFQGVFLPDAIRTFFLHIPPPNSLTQQADELISQFCEHFILCNSDTTFSKDELCYLCYSLFLLSVDLNSPQVKNKMSKREFIRNTRRGHDLPTEYLGYLYDNIYLHGHLAPRLI